MGESIYTTEEILNASAVNKGDKLFSLSESKINKLVTTKLPFIKEVKLKKILPNSVTLTVVPDLEKFSFSHENQFIVTSESYKFLEQKTKAKTK